MTRWFITLFCSLILVGCGSEQSFEDTQGKSIHFSSLQGKWVFVNYWAKWCHSCKEEIPMLNQFYQHHQRQATIIGVSYDALTPQVLASWVKKLDIHYPVLQQDPGKYLKLGSIDVVPTTVVINPQGKVVKRLFGPQTEKSLLKAMQ